MKETKLTDITCATCFDVFKNTKDFINHSCILNPIIKNVNEVMQKEL